MAPGKRTKVFLCGPSFSPEETRGMAGIAGHLEGCGFEVFHSGGDGLEARLLELSARRDVDSGAFRDVCADVSHAIFAIDLYRIIEGCDCLVFNMNGRAPDEGGLFGTAVGFAAGKPLAIYKEDSRTVFHGADNSMISGLSHNFSTVNKVERIPAALADAGRGAAGGDVPPLVRSAVGLGSRLCELRRDVSHSGMSAEQFNEMLPEIKRLCGESRLFDAAAKTDSPKKLHGIAAEKPRVYCSGPLFCPEEKSAMEEIAVALENENCDTFLPHRDGIEAFVMKQVNNPLANALVFSGIKKFINKSIFALDIHQIIEGCGGFVFNMNGRVPDEGGIVETGVAFGVGKPIVIFKSDRRSLFSGCDNPMIRGVMDIFSAVERVEEIPGALAEAVQKVQAAGGGEMKNLPPRVEKTIKSGRNIWNAMKRFR